MFERQRERRRESSGHDAEKVASVHRGIMPRQPYLLGVGPMASGELEPEVYRNMSVVEEWMNRHGAAIKQAKPLADTDTASVPATASGATRYLFVIPKFRDGSKYEKDLLPPADETLTLRGVARRQSVTLLRDDSPLESIVRRRRGDGAPPGIETDEARRRGKDSALTLM